MRSNVLLILFILLGLNSFAQKKLEQEFRIDKEGLPENILPVLSDYLDDVKRLRFL